MSNKFVLNNKVKEFVNSKDLSASKDLYDSLNSVISELLSKAAARAEENGRKTIFPKDL